jgi:D-alanine-D-alanine ligase
MKVAVLYNQVSEGSRADEQDVLIQAETVSLALSELGFEPVPVIFSMDIPKVIKMLRKIRPFFVFNLVEAIENSGRLIHFAPAVLDFMNLSYTGAGTEAMFLSSEKLLAKKILHLAGISTPWWLSPGGESRGNRESIEGTYILKSIWEHASVGLDEDSVITVKDISGLREELKRHQEMTGTECFAEMYIEGREFNLSLLAGDKGPEVLPSAEILFNDYPAGKVKVVGYRAKWEVNSFEYNHTPRSFTFPVEDAVLLERLKAMATSCWQIFGLRGYARVDFRVDQKDNPWVLEVNANPCLSPDAGFFAATQQAGLNFTQVVKRIISDSIHIG